MTRAPERRPLANQRDQIVPGATFAGLASAFTGSGPLPTSFDIEVGVTFGIPLQSPELVWMTLGCWPAPKDVISTLRLQVPLPLLVDTNE